MQEMKVVENMADNFWIPLCIKENYELNVKYLYLAKCRSSMSSIVWNKQAQQGNMLAASLDRFTTG